MDGEAGCGIGLVQEGSGGIVEGQDFADAADCRIGGKDAAQTVGRPTRLTVHCRNDVQYPQLVSCPENALDELPRINYTRSNCTGEKQGSKNQCIMAHGEVWAAKCLPLFRCGRMQVDQKVISRALACQNG